MSFQSKTPWAGCLESPEPGGPRWRVSSQAPLAPVLLPLGSHSCLPSPTPAQPTLSPGHDPCNHLFVDLSPCRAGSPRGAGIASGSPWALVCGCSVSREWNCHSMSSDTMLSFSDLQFPLSKAPQPLVGSMSLNGWL